MECREYRRVWGGWWAFRDQIGMARPWGVKTCCSLQYGFRATIRSRPVHTHTRTCTHAQTHTHIHTRTHAHTRTHTNTHQRTYRDRSEMHDYRPSELLHARATTSRTHSLIIIVTIHTDDLWGVHLPPHTSLHTVIIITINRSSFQPSMKAQDARCADPHQTGNYN